MLGRFCKFYCHETWSQCEDLSSSRSFYSVLFTYQIYFPRLPECFCVVLFDMFSHILDSCWEFHLYQKAKQSSWPNLSFIFEKVYFFLKGLLPLPTSTTDYVVRTETGRASFKYNIFYQTLRFITKIPNMHINWLFLCVSWKSSAVL